MYAGTSLEKLAARVEDERLRRSDYIVDTRELTIGSDGPTEDDGALTMLAIKGHGSFRVGRHAHRQVADRLGIPARFYDRIRADYPGEYDALVNAMFRRAPERRMVRTLADSQDSPHGEARAFLSDRYRRLDNDELLEHVLPVLANVPEIEFTSLDVTDTRMYVKATTPAVEGEVAVGDVVRAGVVISNSEVGVGALRVMPLVVRLVCMNGMTVADRAVRGFHIGKHADEAEGAYEVFSDDTKRLDDAAFFAKVADATRAALSEATFTAIVDRMREAKRGPKMDDPIQAVQVLADRLRLSEGERTSVLTHLIEGGDLTRYGAVNAVTRASQDADSYDRASEMEVMGGQVLTMADREWATIAA